MLNCFGLFALEDLFLPGTIEEPLRSYLQSFVYKPQDIAELVSREEMKNTLGVVVEGLGKTKCRGLLPILINEGLLAPVHNLISHLEIGRYGNANGRILRKIVLQATKENLSGAIFPVCCSAYCCGIDSPYKLIYAAPCQCQGTRFISEKTPKALVSTFNGREINKRTMVAIRMRPDRIDMAIVGRIPKESVIELDWDKENIAKSIFYFDSSYEHHYNNMGCIVPYIHPIVPSEASSLGHDIIRLSRNCGGMRNLQGLFNNSFEADRNEARKKSQAGYLSKGKENVYVSTSSATYGAAYGTFTVPQDQVIKQMTSVSFEYDPAKLQKEIQRQTEEIERVAKKLMGEDEELTLT